MVTRWPAGAWYCVDHDGVHPAGPCPATARTRLRRRFADAVGRVIVAAMSKTDRDGTGQGGTVR